MNPRLLLAAAGFGHLAPWKVYATAVALISGVSLSLVRATGVAAFGIAGILLSATAIVELLIGLAAAREQALTSALPEVCESLASGVASGQELGASLALLERFGPKVLRGSFADFNRLLAKGNTLEAALIWLKREISNTYCDQLVQLLLVSLRIGGSGLVSNLNRLASDIRSQAQLEGELRAKQGWVAGTAKLGVLAPWLIVMFLNQRSEAHVFYSSAAGFNLLVLGLALCLIAYVAIQYMARLPKARRVFADVE